MADIVTMPGVFRPESEPDTPVETALNTARSLGLTDIVVVGRTIGGEIEVVSSPADCDRVIGLLMRGVSWLSHARQVPMTDNDKSG